MLSTSLFNGLTGISQLLFSAWHHYYWLTLTVIALLLGLVIPKLQGNQHLLRNSLRVLTALFILLVASSLAAFLKMPRFAAVTDELVQLGSGMLLIHILGQCVFRVIVPALKLYPPRILEDIIIVLVYFAWAMVRLRDAGLDLSSLITTSAVVTGIVAFSMQETLSNILGGLALQLDQSINIGDWIKVDDVSGRVVQVSWRHTSVRTRNGEVVILPNSLLMKSKFSIVGSEDVQQWRRWINFSLPDSIPPQRIINCIDDALVNANIPNVSESPAPHCLVMDLKNGVANYSVRYWLTDPNLDDPTDSEIRLHIYATLQRHGYSLAHPVLDVTTQNDNERQMYARAQEIRLRENTLRKIDLFKDLSDGEISHLANTLIYAPFAKGSIITHQGAVAHWLYVLISGDVDVWYETSTKQRQHLAELNAGSIFGEHGLMTGQPRRATVTARTNVECYRIDKAGFEHILQSRPELAEAFASILVSRTQQHVEVPNGEIKTTREHQKSQLLDNIRRFFRLDIG